MQFQVAREHPLGASPHPWIDPLGERIGLIPPRLVPAASSLLRLRLTFGGTTPPASGAGGGAPQRARTASIVPVDTERMCAL
eukprot:4133280-Prymnesium_polylepis.3